MYFFISNSLGETCVMFFCVFWGNFKAFILSSSETIRPRGFNALH